MMMRHRPFAPVQILSVAMIMDGPLGVRWRLARLLEETRKLGQPRLRHCTVRTASPR